MKDVILIEFHQVLSKYSNADIEKFEKYNMPFDDVGIVTKVTINIKDVIIFSETRLTSVYEEDDTHDATKVVLKNGDYWTLLINYNMFKKLYEHYNDISVIHFKDGINSIKRQ